MASSSAFWFPPFSFHCASMRAIIIFKILSIQDKIMCPNCMHTKLLCNGRLAPIWMLGELALYCQSLLHASLKNPLLNNGEVSYSTTIIVSSAF